MRKEKTGNGFMVEQFYRIEMAMPMMVESFGRIANGVFIDFRKTPITSRRRSNLFGLRLNASMVITDNDTMNHLTDYRYTFAISIFFLVECIKLKIVARRRRNFSFKFHLTGRDNVIH